MSVLVTGGAGFIGSAVVRQLVLGSSTHVAYVDALTYASNLDSLAEAREHAAHYFCHVNTDAVAVRAVFERERPEAMMSPGGRVTRGSVS